MKLTAKIISLVFHPIIMPTIGLLILFNTQTYINYAIPKELKQFILLLIIMSTLIMPLLIILLLYSKKYISSILIKNRKERLLPYIFTILFYIFSLYMLTKVPVPPIIFKFMIGTTISVIVATLINIKWKISAHMIGLGGLFGALFCVSAILTTNVTLYIIAILVVTGLVGSSRLILKSHTPSQIYLGFLLGIISQIVSFL